MASKYIALREQGRDRKDRQIKQETAKEIKGLYQTLRTLKRGNRDQN